MNFKSIMDFCLSKQGAELTFPFGESPAVIKVQGRIFAKIYAREVKPQITLKCEPLLASLFREKYSGIVLPGYHVINRNKPYWNTILLDTDVITEEELFEMIDHSYHEVMKKVKKVFK